MINAAGTTSRHEGQRHQRCKRMRHIHIYSMYITMEHTHTAKIPVDAVNELPKI